MTILSTDTLQGGQTRPLLRSRVLVRNRRSRHIYCRDLPPGHCPPLLRLVSRHLAPQHPAGRPRHPRQRPHDQGRVLDLPQQVHGHQELPGHHLVHCAGRNVKITIPHYSL